MFTIKHRDNSGHEFISGGYVEVTFEMIAGKPTVYGITGGVIRKYDAGPELQVTASWQPKVWVMNEHGATVASYEL